MADGNDIFYQPGREGKGIFKEKMSKFIAFALPAKSAQEARELIKLYQNEYHDARHVCWAYMTGAARTEWQLNDNGEPSGTAGKPILGQINSLNLTNVVVIVVRYFGGIKLGTPGLIAAYREAARLALEDAGREQMSLMGHIEVSFPYVSMNDVMKIAKTPGVKVEGQTFDNTCTIALATRCDNYPAMKSRLLAVDGVSLISETIET